MLTHSIFIVCVWQAWEPKFTLSQTASKLCVCVYVCVCMRVCVFSRQVVTTAGQQGKKNHNIWNIEYPIVIPNPILPYITFVHVGFLCVHWNNWKDSWLLFYRCPWHSRKQFTTRISLIHLMNIIGKRCNDGCTQKDQGWGIKCAWNTCSGCPQCSGEWWGESVIAGLRGYRLCPCVDIRLVQIFVVRQMLSTTCFLLVRLLLAYPVSTVFLQVFLRLHQVKLQVEWLCWCWHSKLRNERALLPQTVMTSYYFVRTVCLPQSLCKYFAPALSIGSFYCVRLSVAWIW